MITRVRPYLTVQEVTDALKSGDNASTVHRFESDLARFVGAKHAISTNRGRTALLIALQALGIKEGDEVIIPSLTCGVVVDPVLFLRAKPVLVDIDPRTYCIDPAKLRKAISAKTKCIIPVHLYGQPCEMDEVNEIAEDLNLWVIEDCAQALGAEYKGRKVGRMGDAAIFSFGFDKNLTTGEGGMLLTDQDDFHENALEARKESFFWKPWFGRYSLFKLLLRYILTDERLYRSGRYLYKAHSVLRYVRSLLRSDYMNEMNHSPVFLDGFRAKLGLSQLSDVEMMNEKRIRNALFLSDRLKNCKHLSIPYVPPYTKNVFLRYTALMDIGGSAQSRHDAVKFFAQHGFEVTASAYFNPLHLLPPYNRCAKYDRKMLKASEKVAASLLNFPTHPHLAETDLEKLTALSIDLFN